MTIPAFTFRADQIDLLCGKLAESATYSKARMDETTGDERAHHAAMYSATSAQIEMLRSMWLIAHGLAETPPPKDQPHE